MPFWISFFIQLAVGIALAVIAYVLMPKPKREKPPASQDLDAPTSKAGRPIPVVFGTMTVKGSNVLGFADKGKRDYEVAA